MELDTVSTFCSRRLSLCLVLLYNEETDPILLLLIALVHLDLILGTCQFVLFDAVFVSVPYPINSYFLENGIRKLSIYKNFALNISIEVSLVTFT